MSHWLVYWVLIKMKEGEINALEYHLDLVQSINRARERENNKLRKELKIKDKFIENVQVTENGAKHYSFTDAKYIKNLMKLEENKDD